MSVGELAEYIRITKYTINVDGRRETWPEQVARVMGMHREFYGDRLEPIADFFDEAERELFERNVLASMRSHQFGGVPILRKNARIFNCVHRDTEFVTERGVRRFADFSDGDRVCVLTHLGVWKSAVVRSYGEQEMFRHVFTRGNASHEVIATADHRWFHRDGHVTDGINVGDRLLSAPEIFQKFDYYAAEVDERMFWAYGFVLGDGTLVRAKDGTYKNSMVRLCGAKAALLDRFVELGFGHSFPPSTDGDPVVYTGRYLKTLPDIDATPPRLIRAFVAGYLAADGHKARNADAVSPYSGIQTSDGLLADFIRRAFPVAGVYIVSESHIQKDTNYGELDAVSFALTQGQGATAAAFRLKAVESVGVATAWCLEVEDHHSFVLPFGMVTGNCWGSTCDRPRFFQELFWILLCGGGTGFSVQRQHVAKLPPLDMPQDRGDVYEIPDTIEGWADAAGVLWSTYLTNDQPFPDWCGRRVTFDGGRIRPRGAPLSTGAKAPGPEPLLTALELVRARLDQVVQRGGVVSPIDAFDISLFLANAVLAGGVRRSSTLALFSADDQEMMTAKSTPGWWDIHPQRKQANISVANLRSETSRETYRRQVEHARYSGDPGVVWVDDLDQVVNPCAEANFWPFLELRQDWAAYTEFSQELLDYVPEEERPKAIVLDGSASSIEWDAVRRVTRVSGWQACNLSTINASTVTSAQDFMCRARAAATLGTLQAGYLNLDYLGDVTEQIVARESLLGVSITGMCDAPDIAFDPTTLEEGAFMVVETNIEVAAAIGIRESARSTLLKPEGTGSLMLGTFASGVHPWLLRRGIRHVRANVDEGPATFYASHNPGAVFQIEATDRNAANTYVLAFPFEAPEGALVNDDVGAISMLKRVALVQRHWVAPGRRVELATRPYLSHNVSNTIVVRDHEWDEVADYIYDRRDQYVGVTLIGADADKVYHLAPFTRVRTRDEIVQIYGPVAFEQAARIAYRVSDMWAFTNTMLTEPNNISIDEVVDRVQFHELVMELQRFADGLEPLAATAEGANAAVTLLRELDILHRYEKLVAETVPVPWDQYVEVDDQVDFGTEASCQGGACVLTAGDSSSYVAPGLDLGRAK